MLTELEGAFWEITSKMPNRMENGVVGNLITPFTERFGHAIPVCGDQATYMAAQLELRGFDAKVIYGERGPNGLSTHAWVEVNGIELDPWKGKYDSNNRDHYTVTGDWDVPKNQAPYIIQDYNNKFSQDIEGGEVKVATNGVENHAVSASVATHEFAGIIPESFLEQLNTDITFDRDINEIASANVHNGKEKNVEIGIN